MAGPDLPTEGPSSNPGLPPGSQKGSEEAGAPADAGGAAGAAVPIIADAAEDRRVFGASLVYLALLFAVMLAELIL
jgi:hypothetical protein